MSNLDRVAKLLSRRGRWVSALSLMKAGGLLSWRTRVSECRRLLGWAVENRVTVRDGRKVSEYRRVA